MSANFGLAKTMLHSNGIQRWDLDFRNVIALIMLSLFCCQSNLFRRLGRLHDLSLYEFCKLKDEELMHNFPQHSLPGASRYAVVSGFRLFGPAMVLQVLPSWCVIICVLGRSLVRNRLSLLVRCLFF